MESDLLKIQDSIVNLLIRVSALEKILLKNNLLTVEVYQKTILEVGNEVNEKLKEEFAKMQQETKKQEVDKVDEKK